MRGSDHIWGAHKYGDNWRKCICGCVRHSEVQPGWGIYTSYFHADGSGFQSADPYAEPPCTRPLQLTLPGIA